MTARWIVTCGTLETIDRCLPGKEAVIATVTPLAPNHAGDAARGVVVLACEEPVRADWLNQRLQSCGYYSHQFESYERASIEADNLVRIDQLRQQERRQREEG